MNKPKPKHLTTPALLLASLLAGCGGLVMTDAEFATADKARGDALCAKHGGMAASEGWSFGYAPTRSYLCTDGTRV